MPGPASTESECAPRKRISEELVLAVVAITLLLWGQCQLHYEVILSHHGFDIPVDSVVNSDNVQVTCQSGVAVRRNQSKTILS